MHRLEQRRGAPLGLGRSVVWQRLGDVRPVATNSRSDCKTRLGMRAELANTGGLERLRIDLVGNQLHRLFGRNFLRPLGAPKRVSAARLLLRAIARAGVRDRHLDDRAIAQRARTNLAPLDLHRIAILIGKPLDDLGRVGANVVEERLARLGAVLDLL